MRRTDRLFELIQLFRSGQLWKGRDLAEELGVSLRTIYRDIETIVASGVPIEGERGLGYLLREPIFLPPLTLSTFELEALHLGLELALRVGDEKLADAANRIRKKVDAVIPGDRQGRDFASGIAFHIPTSNNTHGFLSVFRQAVNDQRKLNILYRRLDEARTERVIRPLYLEFWGRTWTLTAWCELKSDFRIFRVDHLEKVLVQEFFLKEKGKTYKDYLALQCPEGTAIQS